MKRGKGTYLKGRIRDGKSRPVAQREWGGMALALEISGKKRLRRASFP
jgi:hypothetical protein